MLSAPWRRLATYFIVAAAAADILIETVQTAAAPAAPALPIFDPAHPDVAPQPLSNKQFGRAIVQKATASVAVGPCSADAVTKAAAHAGPELAWCLPVMFDLQHRHIDSLLTWYEYHKRLGVSRVYLSIFESENELLQAGKMEGAKRFLKLPDVHYDVVPDCPRCRRDPLVCRERNNCAQAEAIEKCFLKAKRDGVRWAVFGDTDEFITLHPLEQSWADSDIEFPHNGDSGFDHKDTAEAQGALVQLLNSEFDRYSEVSLGKFVFHMEICELPPGATKLPISNLASAAPCRTKGPTCARCLPKKDKNIRHKRCHAVSTGYIILNADKCPQHGCDADICKGPKGGVDGRRKPILQLPMRNTAVTVHGDWKLGQSVAGTPLASVGDEQCARSHLILSTTKARMYEWQGVGSDRPDNAGKIFNNRTARLEKACIDSGGNSTVVCPPGFVRDTFMAGWAQRHQQKGGGV